MELYINNAHGGLPTLLPFKRLSGWFGGQVRMNVIVQRKLLRGTCQELSGRTTTFLSNSQAIQAFNTELTDLPFQPLNLLGIPQEAFRPH